MMPASTRLLIFAKAPQAGLAKTRLIPALGAAGAADLARQMLTHTLAQALAAEAQAVELCMSPAAGDPAWLGVTLPGALAACRTYGVDSENRPQRGQFLSDLLAHSPAMGQKDGEKWTAAVDSQPTFHKSDRLLELSDQGEGDLGARMNRAMNRALARQAGPVLLMGSDCPALSAAHIDEAARQLAQHDAVLVPAADGGYVLIGLNAPCPELFTQMAWSTPTVTAETLRRMAALGMRVWLGPTLHDIDEAADLAHLPDGFRVTDRRETRPP